MSIAYPPMAHVPGQATLFCLGCGQDWIYHSPSGMCPDLSSRLDELPERPHPVEDDLCPCGYWRSTCCTHCEEPQ